jgi:hypothetical protein
MHHLRGLRDECTKDTGRNAEIVAAYMDGTMTHAVCPLVEQEMAQEPGELQPEEAVVMALLQQRLKCADEVLATA